VDAPLPGCLSEEVEMLAKYPTISFVIALGIIFGLGGGFIAFTKIKAYEAGYEQGVLDGKEEALRIIDPERKYSGSNERILNDAGTHARKE
jgi:hypothetical protein